MRNVARLKMGYYPLPEAEGEKLRSLLSFAGLASVIDPCVGQGTALELVTSDAPVRRYGVELDAERAHIAGSKGIETIQGNTFDTIAGPESFSLLYLNPPYDSEIGTIANRRMEAVFLEHTYRWLRMEGVLILVIPFERLHDCTGILSSHFTSLNVFRMTDPDSVQYRQIAVLAFATRLEARRLRTTSANSNASAYMVVSSNWRSCSQLRAHPIPFLGPERRRCTIAAFRPTCWKTCCRNRAHGSRWLRY